MIDTIHEEYWGDNVRWFMGIVEDIEDPEELGRVRVRCYGIHSPYYSDIAIEDLPWASVMMPAYEGGVSGTGRSPNGLMQGAQVIGIFLDGKQSQNPLIIGAVPRIESEDGYYIIPMPVS